MKKLKAYKKEVISHPLFIKLKGKELKLSIAISCLEDILEFGSNGIEKYSNGVLTILESVGAIEKKWSSYVASDKTQKWLDVLFDAWTQYKED